MGGGTKRNGTLRATAVVVGIGDGDAELVSVGVGDGVGESCATAVAKAASTIPIRNPISAVRNSNIIAPINVREKIVPPLAVREEFFIDRAGYELVVQLIKPREMIERALGCIFPSGTRPHQKCPIA